MSPTSLRRSSLGSAGSEAAQADAADVVIGLKGCKAPLESPHLPANDGAQHHRCCVTEAREGRYRRLRH